MASSPSSSLFLDSGKWMDGSRLGDCAREGVSEIVRSGNCLEECENP